MKEQKVGEYDILCKLGEGAYGSVYKVKETVTGKIMAIKTIRIANDDQGISSTTLREITILKNLDHPNIIKLLNYRVDIISMDPKVELFFEYMDEDLAKMMRRKDINQNEAKNIMKQLLIGVHYMHNKKVFHRDLKPQNVLINSLGDVKIADFGLGRILSSCLTTMSKQIQTLWYRAPQLLFGSKRYDLSVDVWSIGCIFYQLTERNVLFQTESEIGQIMAIMKRLGTPHINQWNKLTNLQYFSPNFPKFHSTSNVYSRLNPEGIDLLQKMIQIIPEKRISVNEALKHDYFK